MTLNQIESHISGLAMQDLSQFAECFEEFYAQKVDEKLATAVGAGKFDALAAKAKKEFDVGNYSNL